jgi:SAM-dependent methyltransferase
VNKWFSLKAVKIKTGLKKVVQAFGYEIRKIQPKAAEQECDPIQDEVISGPWVTDVLHMANQHCRPQVLCYRRTIYGDDQRLKYVTYFLDLRGYRVLELGPLEGHHSILLEKMGVRENIAIEARAENLRRCNRIKEKYGLEHTTFLQQDLERLYSGLEKPQFQGPFDLVFCLGVLYHVPDPAKALAWFRSQASALFLGTHYLQPNPHSDSDVTCQSNGKSYRVREHREGGLADPISGMSPVSVMLYEEDLLSLLREAGYSRVSVLGKDLQNGLQHITILAD